jgi:hypothetical protein
MLHTYFHDSTMARKLLWAYGMLPGEKDTFPSSLHIKSLLLESHISPTQAILESASEVELQSWCHPQSSSPYQLRHVYLSLEHYIQWLEHLKSTENASDLNTKAVAVLVWHIENKQLVFAGTYAGVGITVVPNDVLPSHAILGREISRSPGEYSFSALSLSFSSR